MRVVLPGTGRHVREAPLVVPMHPASHDRATRTRHMASAEGLHDIGHR